MDVSKLVGPQSSSSSTEGSTAAADDYTRRAYLADLERFKDFTPQIVFPAPIGPRWRN